MRVTELNALVPTTATHGQSQEKHSTQNEVEQKEDQKASQRLCSQAR